MERASYRKPRIRPEGASYAASHPSKGRKRGSLLHTRRAHVVNLSQATPARVTALLSFSSHLSLSLPLSLHLELLASYPALPFRLFIFLMGFNFVETT